MNGEPPSGQPRHSVGLRLLLVGATVAVCAGAAELGVRVIDGDRLNQWRLSSAAAPASDGLSRGEQAHLAARRFDRQSAEVARRYVDQLPVAPGVSRAWFDVFPAPLRRPPLPPDLQKVADAVEHSALPPSEMFKAWNARFLQERVCAGDSFFRSFPGFAFAFDPPEPSPYPRYRYLPSVATPAELVTNRFGWRGHEISRNKPPGVVRIAFVGASTTVGSHNQPFSYPEYVERWLNLWAEEERSGIGFEVINAGREGISSTDIAAIVRHELPEVEPDLVVYYEGANQFSFRELVVPTGQSITPPEKLSSGPSLPFVDRFALMRRLDILLRRLRVGAGSEPRKPRYKLNWPDSVREDVPDPDSPALPLDLPRIVRDLDDIHRTANVIGAQVVLTSFVWMVDDRMVVDPVDNAYLYQSLNLAHWPATYADIRRMADFQNRVFRAYADTRGIPFIDYAAVFPRDVRLFGDAVHLMSAGDRLHAWVVLQQLLPLLAADIEAGRLPAAARLRSSEAEAPDFAPKRVALECTDFSRYQIVAGAISVDEIEPSVREAQVLKGTPTRVITPEGRYAYAAEMPIHVRVPGPAVVRVRLRVRSGHVSIGVLSRGRVRWLVQRDLAASSNDATLFLPLSTLDDAGVVLITNAVAADGERSTVDVESADVMALVTDDRLDVRPPALHREDIRRD